jgi:hypothetical protein
MSYCCLALVQDLDGYICKLLPGDYLDTSETEKYGLRTLDRKNDILIDTKHLNFIHSLCFKLLGL